MHSKILQAELLILDRLDLSGLTGIRGIRTEIYLGSRVASEFQILLSLLLSLRQRPER